MARSGVECILIGGLAGAVHGSAHVTYDVDFCYRRTPENLQLLATTLAPHHPYLASRGREASRTVDDSAALRMW